MTKISILLNYDTDFTYLVVAISATLAPLLMCAYLSSFFRFNGKLEGILERALAAGVHKVD